MREIISKLVLKILFLLLLAQGSFAADYQYFQSNGLQIAYREFGSGIPLVVLNGGPGRSSDTFVPLAEKLANLGFKAIIFDQRGTGKSKIDLNEKNITFDLMIEDLENLRKHLKLDAVSVLGHSFGGMYAMGYASKYPNRIRFMVLSASGGIDLSWQDHITANMLSKITPKARKKFEYWEKKADYWKSKGNDELYTLASHESRRQLVPAYIYHPEFIPQLERDLTNPVVDIPKVNDLVWKSMDGKYDLKGAFSNLEIPTLILSGRQDILGEEVPLTIQREIPKSTVKFFNECSHYPWLDQPVEYFAAIQSFVRE